MTNKWIGKKEGMMQIFDKDGQAIVCTVVKMSKHYVVQLKNKDTDGYSAIQVGSVEKKKNVNKPDKGHFDRAKVTPCKYLFESRMNDVEGFSVGQELKCEFKEGDFLDFVGISKGKGFQGVMKKFGFAGGPAAHGSGFHRHAGSTGMRSTPGRCFPGGKRASRLGGKRVTQQSLKVLEVNEKENVILVKGSIPGNKGSQIFFSKAIKKN